MESCVTLLKFYRSRAHISKLRAQSRVEGNAVESDTEVHGELRGAREVIGEPRGHL